MFIAIVSTVDESERSDNSNEYYVLYALLYFIIKYNHSIYY